LETMVFLEYTSSEWKLGTLVRSSYYGNLVTSNNMRWMWLWHIF
jgi:hypothetical protein